MLRVEKYSRFDAIFRCLDTRQQRRSEAKRRFSVDRPRHDRPFQAQGCQNFRSAAREVLVPSAVLKPFWPAGEIDLERMSLRAPIRLIA